MLSWHLYKAATNFGETKSFFFWTCQLLQRLMSLAKTLHQSWENWCPVLDMITHAMLKKYIQLFLFFHLPLFIALTSLLSQQFFYLPPPSNPDNMVLSVCVWTFYLPLFSFFRGHLRVWYQMSYTNPFGISPTAAYEYLGILDYFFFNLPQNMKIHKFVYTVWRGFHGYSCLFPKNNALMNNKICAFT